MYDNIILPKVKILEVPKLFIVNKPMEIPELPISIIQLNLFYINKKGSEKYIKNKISKNISSAIYLSIKEEKHGRHWEELVNYNLDDLIVCLENQFKPGMSWSNYGKWHIDHIIPISRWDYKTSADKEFKQCWALANLQPLWAKENLRKGNRI